MQNNCEPGLAVWSGPVCSAVAKLPQRLFTDRATPEEKQVVERIKKPLFGLSAAMNELLMMLPEHERASVSVDLVRRLTPEKGEIPSHVSIMNDDSPAVLIKRDAEKMAEKFIDPVGRGPQEINIHIHGSVYSGEELEERIRKAVEGALK